MFPALSDKNKALISVLIIVPFSILIAWLSSGWQLALLIAGVQLAVVFMARHVWMNDKSNFILRGSVLAIISGVVLFGNAVWQPFIAQMVKQVFPNLPIPDYSVSPITLLFLLLIATLVFHYTRDKTPIEKPEKKMSDLISEPTIKEKWDNICQSLSASIRDIDRSTNWDNNYYTPLDAEVEMRTSNRTNKVVKDLLAAIKESDDRLFLLVGDPGAGKSVALRKLCLDMLKDSVKTEYIPIYVNLKEWTDTKDWTKTKPTSEDLRAFIKRSLLQKDTFLADFFEKHYDVLDHNGNLFFILDSFDEMPQVLGTTADAQLIEDLTIVCREFLQGSKQKRSKGILASRGYSMPIEGYLGATTKLTIRPFTFEKIENALTQSGEISKNVVRILFEERPELLESMRNPFVTSLVRKYLIINKTLPGNLADVFENFPREVTELGNEAIYSYWKQGKEQGGLKDIDEAKLIIVGEGGTGKTTLFEKLRNSDHNPYKKSTPETHGINILEGLGMKDGFRANIWDFGGQELQYMTHQFFLTPRALYVLVIDARLEAPNLSYWFKIISLLGRDSDSEKVELLLVFNKRKGSTGTPQFEDRLAYYKDDFNYDFMEVDFAVNDYRWEYLRQKIDEKLLRLTIKLPKQWNFIKEALRKEALQKPHISTERFAEICATYKINDEQDQLLGSAALHNLGQLLHFQNDKGLRSHIILSPKWAVKGVYSFLKEEEIIKNNGRFSENQFLKILAKKNYKANDADLILQLMTRNNFDICYTSNDGNYVAAQLLPDNRPTQYSWHQDELGALQFCYQYPTMPKGLISRLIVRLSKYIENIGSVEVVWKKGAILKVEKDSQICRVLMQEDDAESQSGLRQITIEVMGEPAYRKFALQKIRDEVEELHTKWFRNIKVDQIVPCCCERCRNANVRKTYLLNDLLELWQEEEMKQCLTGKMISIQKLLEGVYPEQEIELFKKKDEQMKNKKGNITINQTFNAPVGNASGQTDSQDYNEAVLPSVESTASDSIKKQWYEFHWIKSFGKAALIAIGIIVLIYTVKLQSIALLGFAVFCFVAVYFISSDPFYLYSRFGSYCISILGVVNILPFLDSSIKGKLETQNGIFDVVFKLGFQDSPLLSIALVILSAWLFYLQSKKIK